jgi:O-antigen/teichoic acid export membrane protein
LLLPMFSRMLRHNENVNDLIRIAMPLLMVAGLTAAISCNYYKKEVIDLLYVAHAPYSSKIFGVLMIGYLFISTSYLYGTLLTANNNLRHLNILAASTVVINISLNLILIPKYQAYGAAISSLISQGYYAIAQLILAVYLIKIPTNRDILIRLGGFLVINLLVGYLSLLIPGWIPGFSILLVSCLITSLALGLIRPTELRAILKEK